MKKLLLITLSMLAMGNAYATDNTMGAGAGAGAGVLSEIIIRTPEQQTAFNRLLLAAQTAEETEALIQDGAEAYAKVDGTYPIIRAVGNGDLEKAAVLLKHGADINAVSDQGNTALHLATSAPGASIETAEWLLEHGANPRLVTRYFGNDPRDIFGVVKNTWSGAPEHPMIKLVEKYYYKNDESKKTDSAGAGAASASK